MCSVTEVLLEFFSEEAKLLHEVGSLLRRVCLNRLIYIRVSWGGGGGGGGGGNRVGSMF